MDVVEELWPAAVEHLERSDRLADCRGAVAEFRIRVRDGQGEPAEGGSVRGLRALDLANER